MTEMEVFLNHPAVQAGVLPFAAALLVAAALSRTRQYGLAIAAGVLCAAGLTMGLGLEPLTSVKKLVLAGLAVAVLGVAFELTADQPRWPHRLVIGVMVCFSVLWVLHRILLQAGGIAAIVTWAGAALYCVALLSGGERASRDTVCAAAAALVLGLTTGVLALLGASAQLAQLGIAMGAGAGAVLLLQMLASPSSWTLGLSAHVTAGLLGLLAVFTGSLPWYCLLPLPLIPWAASLAPVNHRPAWQRAVLAVLFALVPAFFAVALAWLTAGGAIS